MPTPCATDMSHTLPRMRSGATLARRESPTLCATLPDLTHELTTEHMVGDAPTQGDGSHYAHLTHIIAQTERLAHIGRPLPHASTQAHIRTHWDAVTACVALAATLSYLIAQVL